MAVMEHVRISTIRRTTFHQFDDQAASRQPIMKTELVERPPRMSPPSRPTDLEPSLHGPATDLEQAFVPGGRNWVKIVGVLLFVLGLGGAVAWWLTQRPG